MQPSLSICIPTKNRCGYLYFTLKNITENSFFRTTNEVEIVVSDNCSTDATEEIVKMFQEKYPDKIVYGRNNEDLYDKNFEKVLSLANGKVLKLHNDNFLFKDDSLEFLVNKIKEVENEKPLLFFTNGNSKIKNDVLCNNLTEFVDAASYLLGWIASFSLWKEDFEKIPDFSKNFQTCFIQTDILLRLSTEGRKILVINKAIFYGNGILKKGGGNIAKIFAKNYLSLFKPYLKSKILDRKIYEQEKKFLLLNHVIPMKFYDSLKNEYSWFINDGYWRYLIRDYWYNAYFYFSVFKILRLTINAGLSLIGHKLNKNYYQKLWSKRNKENETTIEKGTDITKLFVGNNVKGHINVEFTKNMDEALIIDNDVIIEDNIKFVFDSKNLILIKEGTKIPANSIINSNETNASFSLKQKQLSPK